jgi:tRNA threonylcarbamoyladenosine biosynthesis protein TsaB
MRVLAIDTATEACSAALELDGQVLERYEVAGRSHTERLLPQVHALLAEAGITFAQIDGFICGVGPGSFAGVRIGVSFVKGLALALDRPVVPVTSLAMLAQPALEGGAQAVMAAIDARMNEVYAGTFRADASGLATPSSAAIVSAPERVRFEGEGPWVAVGTGWARHEAALRAGLSGKIVRLDATALPRAATALTLARAAFAAGNTITADALAPVYLRDQVALTLEEQRRAKSRGEDRG